MAPDTKTCLACKSEIHPHARVCPHCRSPQGYRGYLIVALIALPFLVLLGVSLWTRSRVSEAFDAPKYSAYANALAVTHSDTVYSDAEGRCGPTVTTFGTIANSSDIPWKDVQLEVKHFDREGHLVDAGAEQALDTFVPARGQGAFRIQFTAARERDAYAKHEVVVHYARYGAGRW
jgi:hypothetical protein